MADQHPDHQLQDDLAALLGSSSLARSSGEARYARTTSPTDEVPPAAVAYPRTVKEVQGILGIARRHAVPVYPISRGRNWGYGDACAPHPGQIILDLSRMNRILEVNEQLCYCVIEPGVSQGELYAYLKEHHPNLWMDATGAGLDASLVGNTVDRGFGHTRYGDHFLTACGMQVVLADGRVLETGFGHFPNARAHRVYRYGVGPFLDGLFAQSNLGIVTRLGLWLTPKPEAFTAFFFYCDRDDQLPDLVDRLAPLRMQGLLQSTIHIGNDLRVMSARTRYPYDLTGGQTPLPADVRERLRRQYGIGAWNGGGAIYGTRGMVRSIKRKLAHALGGKYHLRFVDDRRLALAQWLANTFAWTKPGRTMGELLEVLRPVYGLMKGEPSDEPLRGAAWRLKDPEPAEPADPLDIHAGLMWASPVLPNRGADARDLLALIEPIYARHGFEALVTFTMITERAMIAVTNLSFDRRDEAARSQAKACYDELLDAMIPAGFIPYRTSPSGAARLREQPSVYWDLTARLKQTLDPESIIAPGRYLPEEPRLRREA